MESESTTTQDHENEDLNYDLEQVAQPIAAARIADKRCAHINETGARCRGYATRSGLCAGHSRLGVAADPQAYAHHGAKCSAEVRQRRAEERKRGFIDALRAEYEARAEEIVARKLEIIEQGTDADALRAMESIEARICGKPKETVVTEIPEPKTLEDLRAMSREQRRALLLELERQRGGRSLVPHNDEGKTTSS